MSTVSPLDAVTTTDDLNLIIQDLEAQKRQAETTYHQVEGALRLAHALLAKHANGAPSQAETVVEQQAVA